MHARLPKNCAVLATLLAVLASCAAPVAEPTYTVQKIDASRRSDGPLRVQLTTPGSFAEADADLIVSYVKIVAVRVATKRQRAVAQAHAHAVARKLPPLAQGFGKPNVRYLAVATEPGPPLPGKKAAKSVMIWDTHAEEIVGNDVYDLATAPPVGTVARFETRVAEYVGDGR